MKKLIITTCVVAILVVIGIISFFISKRNPVIIPNNVQVSSNNNLISGEIITLSNKTLEEEIEEETQLLLEEIRKEEEEKDSGEKEEQEKVDIWISDSAIKAKKLYNRFAKKAFSLITDERTKDFVDNHLIDINFDGVPELYNIESNVLELYTIKDGEVQYLSYINGSPEGEATLQLRDFQEEGKKYFLKSSYQDGLCYVHVELSEFMISGDNVIVDPYFSYACDSEYENKLRKEIDTYELDATEEEKELMYLSVHRIKYMAYNEDVDVATYDSKLNAFNKNFPILDRLRIGEDFEEVSGELISGDIISGDVLSGDILSGDAFGSGDTINMEEWDEWMV